ncbi:glycosyltransferase, family [Sedimentisphaera cyanobacteriorum]|uniref:Glycosyltransferase, family n=1 Tax=Sedimentisphaera cyanobacteriorum TaxID=1940790 RepID=A0A1Q2HPX7_9BACT|nr:GT-D fold domain-containing glycosyltransferase [Sedimentisphaera cyanobacteriorum]AQQ09295.1 glycosyltransferase, family [Sedimentisphaera cyanobacteriorum]
MIGELDNFWKKLRYFSLRHVNLFLSSFILNSDKRKKFRENADSRLIEHFRKDIDKFISLYPAAYCDEETLREILHSKKSVCRFGDGEFKLIVGERHKSFQDVNSELNRRMLEVLKSNKPDIIVAIFPVSDFDSLGKVWQKFAVRIGDKVLKLLEPERKYYSALCFRNLPTDGKSKFIERVQLIKQIWQNRKILIVVGKAGRFTFEKELFNNARSADIVYAPAKNAFAKYDIILNKIKAYNPKEYLVLLVLGPTAAVMAYDLAKLGYQAIDFGQMPGTFRRTKKKLFGSEDHIIEDLFE